MTADVEIVTQLKTEDRIMDLTILDELDIALGRHPAHILVVAGDASAEDDSPQIELAAEFLTGVVKPPPEP